MCALFFFAGVNKIDTDTVCAFGKESRLDKDLRKYSLAIFFYMFPLLYTTVGSSTLWFTSVILEK